MNHIFISYRRGDSAGHAGRLFDRLKEHLGAEHVFMDVTDLRPGQDFVAELERAVARADCLLAVIGPRWLDAADAAGRRRIDDPDDFVHREVGAALSQGASVIPVLVHGAAMPRAEDLPEALRPLARRQAIALADTRWDRDVQDLVRLLSGDGTGARAQPAAGALALGAVVAGGSWWGLQARGRAPAAASSAGDGPPGAAIGGPGPGATAASPAAVPRFAITLPPLAEVRFRTHRAQLVVTILAIRQEPRDGATQVLTFLVRMLDLGPSDEAFGSDQFRLVAGDQSLAPATTLIGAVEATEAKEASLRFVAPHGIDEVALEVRVGAETTRIPVSLAARSPIPADPALDEFGRPRRARVVDVLKAFPAALPVGQQADVGGAAYRIVAAVIERETVEKASLTLTVRCSVPRGSGGVGFGSGTVRLWVDGVPRAPANFVNRAVDAGDSQEDRFVFDLTAMPQTLEVGLLNAGDSVRLPLSLAALPRR